MTPPTMTRLPQLTQLVHAAFTLAVVLGYIVLTALGKDGNVLIGTLTGQAASVGIQATTSAASNV